MDQSIDSVVYRELNYPHENRGLRSHPDKANYIRALPERTVFALSIRHLGHMRRCKRRQMRDQGTSPFQRPIYSYSVRTLYMQSTLLIQTIHYFSSNNTNFRLKCKRGRGRYGQRCLGQSLLYDVRRKINLEDLLLHTSIQISCIINTSQTSQSISDISTARVLDYSVENHFCP